MAITASDVARALRIDSPDTEQSADIERLIKTTAEMVERYAPSAPEIVADEARLRIAGWLYDSPVSVGRSGGSPMVLSGAAGLLAPYRTHAAGNTGQSAAPAPTPGPSGSGVDEVARTAANEALRLARMAESNSGAAVDTANQALMEAQADALTEAEGDDADTPTGTAFLAWSAALIARLVRGVVPAWARAASPPKELPAHEQIETRGLFSRGGSLFWELVNQVPDTPGEQSAVGHALTVTGTDDEDYAWRAPTDATARASAKTALDTARTAEQDAAAAKRSASTATARANEATATANNIEATANAADAIAKQARTLANTARDNAATADGKAVAAQRTADAADGKATAAAEAAATADGKAVTADNKAVAAQLDTDTIIEISPDFTVGETKARNLNVYIRHPLRAYSEADILEVNPVGGSAVLVAYNPASLTQTLNAEISASTFMNLRDNGSLSAAGKFVDVEIRLRKGRGGPVHFFRTVPVPVVAAPMESTGTGGSAPVTPDEEVTLANTRSFTVAAANVGKIHRVNLNFGNIDITLSNAIGNDGDKVWFHVLLLAASTFQQVTVKPPQGGTALKFVGAPPQAAAGVMFRTNIADHEMFTAVKKAGVWNLLPGIWQ